VELIKDYDCVIDYHRGRANVVADALSRKSKLLVIELNDCDEKELIELRKIDAKVEVGTEGSLFAQLRVKLTFREKVLEAQQKDIEVDKVKEKIKLGIETPFWILDDGMVLMGKRMYLPGDQVLKEELLKEAHETRLNIHPGSIKMYNDL